MKSECDNCETVKSDVEFLQVALKMLYGSERDELALKLMRRFGNVRGIFSASYDELIAVKGVTDRVAVFFAAGSAAERQAILRAGRGITVDSEADAVKFAMTYFAHSSLPIDAIVYISDTDEILETEQIVSYFDTRDVISRICRHGSSKFLWIRNLPYLVTYPTTTEVKRLDCMIKVLHAAELMGLRLIDYITIVGNDFLGIRGSYSLRNAADASNAQYPDESVVKRLSQARDTFVAQTHRISDRKQYNYNSFMHKGIND